MKNCDKCKKSVGFLQDTGVYDYLCKKCYEEVQIEQGIIPEITKPKVDRWQAAPKDVLLTTETNPDVRIEKRIEIITAECVFGMHIFKDMFAGIRDIFGGRSGAVQDTLRDARKTVLKELKQEAHWIGANAVIGVDLDYSEISGGGKSMLFLVASGTAVIINESTVA